MDYSSTSTSREPRGLLVVGHGTRSEQGQAEFRETVQMLACRLPTVQVQGCFLEFAPPAIDEGLRRLVQQGCREIVVLPLLLFAAGHALEDIPAAVRAAARQHVPLKLYPGAHLGCHERLLALSAQRYLESFAGEEARASPRDTLWLMVGRGAREPAALEELSRFVELRQRETPVGQVRTAYLSMAEPRVEAILPHIAALHFRRVVVQPHLLFHGDLMATLADRVAVVSRQWPDQDWRICNYLGVSEHVVEALADRFADAFFREPLLG